MVRVRVCYPDGIFRGGLLTVEHYPRHRYRTWDAPPHREYVEALVHSEGDCWYLLRLSKTPEYDRPEEDIDAFDAASRAIRYSDEDALEWFREQKIRPPTDLVHRTATTDHSQARDSVGTADEESKNQSIKAPSRQERKYQWLAHALLIVKNEPHISNAEIARRVNVSPSTLSRSKEFRAAAGIARGATGSKAPLGYKLDDGGVEAVEDPTGKYEKHFHRNESRNASRRKPRD